MSFERDSRPFAIRVRNVTKRYTMFERPEDRFKQMVVPRLERLVGRQPRRYYKDFAALNDISFELGRGQVIGIIGRNGSGKSTLLQVICGTLPPTSGTVEVNGRIAALLELGAGFNREFTGRENVHLNASILGVPREEMAWRFEQIEKFAEIGDFIDQPVKTYSSGMYMRLAFATAINVDPDILVVDESLGVGDEAFQRKCMTRIEQIKEAGATILFTSHGAQTIIQLCTSAILIDSGEKILEGSPKRVASQYQRLVNLRGEEARLVREEIKALASLGDSDDPLASNTPAAKLATPTSRQSEILDDGFLDPSLISQTITPYEETGGRISDVRIVNTHGAVVNVLTQGCVYAVQYTFTATTDVDDLAFGTLFKSPYGVELCGGNTDRIPSLRLKSLRAGESVQVNFEFKCLLRAGVYFINVGAMGNANFERQYLHRILDAMIFKVMPAPDEVDYGFFSLGMTFRLNPADSASDTLKIAAA
ncbi:ABC transporter related protein [Mesorhizobium plurifarium]|uniref:ABC transporter related protein n=1 Tax=Mesorhizobium plurifarium TaxID=69974 RepID=A0A090G362_MESPL|nr:ABC transporter related protein [Mesorhizobium plurifarium]